VIVGLSRKVHVILTLFKSKFLYAPFCFLNVPGFIP
jgi:hypothetical protein